MFMNMTGSLGTLFQYFTINITGSELLSVISIFLFFIVIALLFKMPIEIIGDADQQEPTIHEKGGRVFEDSELIVQALNDIVTELRLLREVVSRLRT